MRKAAIRRTDFEMGIKLSLFDVQCGARILYYAQACETFAEYEMDYIIFAKKEVGQFQINPDEVDSYDFIKLRDLDDFILDKKSKGELITPWFDLIHNTKLKPWWEDLISFGRFPDEA